MIPTPQEVLGCAVLAATSWSVIGLAVTLRVGFRSLLAWSVAPIIGFATHSTLAFPLLAFAGFSRGNVTATFIRAFISSAISIWRQRNRIHPSVRDVTISISAVVGAAVLACCVAAAIMPTVTLTGVTLAAAIFDHSKIAMIDDMVRVGLPAGNPFFGQQGDPHRLAYYYLWHFSAAELGLMTGAGVGPPMRR